MGEKTAFENGRISDFQGLVTLTLDRVILHTVMHHLSTSTYIPNFTEDEETFYGWTDGRTEDGRTFETHFIRSTQRSRRNKDEETCMQLVMSKYDRRCEMQNEMKRQTLNTAASSTISRE